MKTVIHKAQSRGYADHGWLQSWHTFSFARYYDPTRIHFGELRVLNDDTVTGGEGFGTHPHENMEIVSIPLAGELRHEDSMGNRSVLRTGEVQVMSAGTGITHSEYNNLSSHPVKFLQIWVFPDRDGLTPRYENILLPTPKPNELTTFVAPWDKPEQGAARIHQQAWFHLMELHRHTFDYKFRTPNSGLYVFVLEGEVEIAGQKLSRRDGIGIWETPSVELTSESTSRLLLIEIPI